MKAAFDWGNKNLVVATSKNGDTQFLITDQKNTRPTDMYLMVSDDGNSLDAHVRIPEGVDPDADACTQVPCTKHMIGRALPKDVPPDVMEGYDAELVMHEGALAFSWRECTVSVRRVAVAFWTKVRVDFLEQFAELPTDVCITTPIGFSDFVVVPAYEGVLKEVFPDTRVVFTREPYAAFFGRNIPSGDCVSVVVDIGHGTVDVAVLSVNRNGDVQVIRSSGSDKCAGRSHTQAMYAHLHEIIGADSDTPIFTMADAENAKQRAVDAVNNGDASSEFVEGIMSVMSRRTGSKVRALCKTMDHQASGTMRVRKKDMDSIFDGPNKALRAFLVPVAAQARAAGATILVLVGGGMRGHRVRPTVVSAFAGFRCTGQVDPPLQVATGGLRYIEAALAREADDGFGDEDLDAAGHPMPILEEEAAGGPSGEAAGGPSGEAAGGPSGEAAGGPSGKAAGGPSGAADAMPILDDDITASSCGIIYLKKRGACLTKIVHKVIGVDTRLPASRTSQVELVAHDLKVVEDAGDSQVKRPRRKMDIEIVEGNFADGQRFRDIPPSDITVHAASAVTDDMVEGMPFRLTMTLTVARASGRRNLRLDMHVGSAQCSDTVDLTNDDDE